MNEASAALREPWETLDDQRRVALFGMWTFIASEVLFFGAILMGFAFMRVLHPAAFAEAARHTDLVFGAVNTALLITSSFTMVMGARAAELRFGRSTIALLSLTAALGLAFLVVKGFEYRQDLDEHLFPGFGFALRSPAAQVFFSFYWGVTAVHAIHLTIGIGLVLRLALMARRGGLALFSPQFEVTALYWGFVDVVWLVVFPLIYLSGGRG